MKITNSFNNNFGALFGKRKVVINYDKNRNAKQTTVQYIHPFKDEFKNEGDKDAWLKSFYESEFYKTCTTGSKNLTKEYQVVMCSELPFTKEVFVKAKKDGVDLLADIPDFYAVTTIEQGYSPSVIFENNKFDCLA